MAVLHSDNFFLVNPQTKYFLKLSVLNSRAAR